MTDQDLDESEYNSTTSDQIFAYVKKAGITFNYTTLTKSSGDSSNSENREFYEVNAAFLVQVVN